jgi:citrate lyase subunit beta/citryl-CoA lyase
MSRIWRSMLYVPANVPRFVAKAPTAGADAVILDLEDSVPADRKEEARAALAEAVPTARSGGADVLVRINRPLPLAVADLQAVIAAGADGILLTKTLGPDHVVLAGRDAGRGASPDAHRPDDRDRGRAPQDGGDRASLAARRRAADRGGGPGDRLQRCGDDELLALAKRQMVLAACAAGVAPSARSARSPTTATRRGAGAGRALEAVGPGRRQLHPPLAGAGAERGLLALRRGGGPGPPPACRRRGGGA